MNNNPTRSLPLLALATLALAFVGCPDSTARESAQAGVPLAQPDIPGSDQDKLKSHSFAQRTEFASAVREIAIKLDERLAGLRSNPPGTQPDESRTKALEEAKNTRLILDERLAKIDQAIPENWESVRDEVLTALAQVQTAYDRLTVN